MRKLTRIGLLLSAAVLLLIGGLFVFRLPLLLNVMAFAGAPPLLPAEEVVLGESEIWSDDFYTVERLDEVTYAISEPRYFRDVYSYLIVGTNEALLIDSGSPLNDISKVVVRLTDKPVSVIASHLHFDHVGNHTKFDQVIMPDIAALRSQTQDGFFSPGPLEHLGAVEGFDIAGWPVHRWWSPDQDLNLGGVSLSLLLTPGHTPDSISIWDKARQRVFMGDYAGDGEVYAFLPNSSLGMYLKTTESLLARLPTETRLFAAHGSAETRGAPEVGLENLRDLRDGLLAMRAGEVSGEGFWPRAYPINRNTKVLADWKGPGGSTWDFE